MKNRLSAVLVALVLLCTPVLGMAQSISLDFVKKYENKKGITLISISPYMFRLLSKIESSDPEYKNVKSFASQIHSFMILIDENTGDSKLDGEVRLLQTSLEKAGYQDLMTIKSDEESIRFQVIEKNGRIQEFIMSIVGEENLVMILKGDFNLDELLNISDDMDIEGMDRVKELDTKGEKGDKGSKGSK